MTVLPIFLIESQIHVLFCSILYYSKPSGKFLHIWQQCFVVLEGGAAGVQHEAKRTKRVAFKRNRVILWTDRSEKCHLWRNQWEYWQEGEEGIISQSK